MMSVVKKFLSEPTQENAQKLIRCLRCSNLFSLAETIGRYIETLFNYDLNIKEEFAIILYYCKKYRESYLKFKEILTYRGISERMVKNIISNQRFCIPYIENDFNYYNSKIINKITNRKRRNVKLITFTITTCKRFELFQKTMNSFINCCTDIEKIDEWLCVDDNSSPEDRTRMKTLYPFINFYMKENNEKGHPKSMNIILEKVKTPYFFHMEDDFLYFERKNYISECMMVLNSNEKYGQCLVNKNYAETSNDWDISGGIYKTTSDGNRYYTHEFCQTENEKSEFHRKYGNNVKNCFYWPHFSFRPSLIKKSVLEEIGNFNEEISHFEMDYAYKYTNAGYVSVFLENIYCKHIGRLTSEKDDKTKENAYTLNDEAQFSGKEEKLKQKDEKLILKTFVINLDHRTDRLENIQKMTELKNLVPVRFSAINGSKLKKTPQLQQIFDFNDYNMRCGMVGCLLSHVKLYIDLLKEERTDCYLILEDDIELVDDFCSKFLHCIRELQKKGDWDIFFLGHHLWPQYKDNEVYSKTIQPKVEHFDRAEILRRSIGGTGGYLITKKGALNILEYINTNGSTNGIDTIIQKTGNINKIYYSYPHLIYSDNYTGNTNVDTDIQTNFDSLTLPIHERLDTELEFYDNIKKIDDIDEARKLIRNCDFNWYCSFDRNILLELEQNCTYSKYTLSDKYLFVVPFNNPERFFHRFKLNENWNINEAITYV